MKGRERLRWAFACAGLGALGLVNHACAETTCEETRTCPGATTGGAGGAGGSGGTGGSDAGGTGGVPPVGSFGISVEASSLTLIEGKDLEITVTITRNAMTDPITLDFVGLPSGATATPVVATAAFKTSKIVIQSDATLVHGAAKVTLSAQGGGQEKTLDLDLLARGPAGSLDNSFASGGQLSSVLYGEWTRAYDAAVAPDGKIYLVGDAGTTAAGVHAYFVARYLEAGTLDSAFGSNGVVVRYTTASTGEHVARGVLIDSSQRPVVGGYFTGGQLFVARFDASGTPDSTFASTGEVTGPGGSAFALAASATKTLAAGKDDKTPAHAMVGRIDGSGVPDNAFGVQSFATVNTGAYASEAVAVAVDADGKIVLAGTSNNPTGPVVVARFTPGGAPDIFGTSGITYFNPGNGAATTAMAVRPDKRIVVGGASSTGASFLVQLDAQGALDASFAAAPGPVGALALDASGRVVSAHVGTTLSVSRVNQDGSQDATFGSGGYSSPGVTAAPRRIVILPDGRALIVGVSSAPPKEQVYLARLWM